MKLGNPIFADESGSHATSAKELDYKDAERYSWQPEKTDWSTPPTIQDDREDDEIVAAWFFVFGRISAMVGIFVRVLFRFFFKFSFTYFLFLQTPSSGIGSPTMANRSINHRPCGISSHSPPFFIDYSSTIQRVTIRFSGLTSVIIVVVIIITATADADDRDEDYYCEPFPVARRPSFFCLLLLKTKKKIKDNKKRNSQQSCQPTVSSPVESIKGEFGCWAATAAERVSWRPHSFPPTDRLLSD